MFMCESVKMCLCVCGVLLGGKSMKCVSNYYYVFVCSSNIKEYVVVLYS